MTSLEKRPNAAGDPASRLIFVAHQDDDTLFMHRDLRNQLDSGGAMTTVFVTAGDAGMDQRYWGARETGAKAAYSSMTGLNDWVDETVTLNVNGQSYALASSHLVERPDVRLYFLRLPDGPGGAGSATYGRQSLEKLWMRDIEVVNSVDTGTAYSRADVLNLMMGLMWEHQPDTVQIQDAYSRYASGEHSDHQHVARFSMLAHQFYEKDHELTAYIGYSSRFLDQNVTGEEYQRGYDAFNAYGAYDRRTWVGMTPDGDPVFHPSYPLYLGRQYTVDDFTTYWANDFAQQAGGWRVGNHLRLVADVTGDGAADIVGFGAADVWVGQSNLLGFDKARSWTAEFSRSAGWANHRHEREMADVNGDGRADVIGFGDDGAWVALSNGRGFDAARLWIDDYGHLAGRWRTTQHERALGDVDGDGLADIVGFGNRGIMVSLSTGEAFASAELWSSQPLFRVTNIDPTRHLRDVADVNGDGMADAILFADRGVLVALSNGEGFDPATLWIRNFGYEAGGWQVGQHERRLADVNGDGMADVIGFGHAGVMVSLSTGSGFGAARRWTTEDDFRAANWDPTRHLREVADVNGDGRADLIWFDDYGARVSLSDGTGFVTPSYDEFQF